MKIRVNFEVEVNDELLQQLVDLAAAIGLEADGPPWAVAVEVLRQHGTAAVDMAGENAWGQRLELAEVDGGEA